ncbi:MAG: HlyD family secretion protein [Paracoccaceae bacterium]
MLELLICSMFTLLPDYLYRRYAQGKRFGQELDLFTVWYELRWGITGCAILTISLITVVFFFHPTTTDVTSFFRTVTILSEKGGRVDEVYVRNGQEVKAGDKIFKLDDSVQQAAVDTAREQVDQVEASFVVAEAQLEAAVGQVHQAEGALEQAVEEFETRNALLQSNSPAANKREVERAENNVAQREGALEAALANQSAVEANLNTLLPAQRDTAAAALAQAEAELAKTVVYAGTDGIIQQFALQPGDIANPVLRPAGILVPASVGAGRFEAGFNQLAAPVIKEGMVGELSCSTKAFTIVPMRVVTVTDYIPAGQFRPSDQLLDVQDRARPGTVGVVMEPLFEGGTDGIPRGSKCRATLYTDNHERLHSDEELTTLQRIGLHVIDTVALVPAILIRSKTVRLPIEVLVLSGH